MSFAHCAYRPRERRSLLTLGGQAPQPESAMTHPQNDIMIRSITGAEELDLFCALDYIFNDELADDSRRMFDKLRRVPAARSNLYSPAVLRISSRRRR